MALHAYLTLLTSLICIVSAYQEEYRGFDNCGTGGWHCNNDNEGLEIVFKCDSKFDGARLWLWTARIPSTAVSYVIEDCDHVELHIDCTVGYRPYTLRQFQVRNVRHLEILKPLRPQIFLHDNDQVPHAPPEFILTNVKVFTWIPGVFDRAGGRCRTKQQFLQKIDFTNVSLPDFGRNMFKDLSLTSFYLKNVEIDRLSPSSLNINATSTINITECNIRVIDEEAITISAENINFSGNQIKKIEEKGITALSTSFYFLENNVDELSKNGLVVKAHYVKIIKNIFHSLKSFAFDRIEPGQKWFTSYKTFTKFLYEFSNNMVMSYQENSLAPAYEQYTDSCSKIIIENNQFFCSCEVPKTTKKEFPELFSTSNLCLTTNVSLLRFVTCRHAVCNSSNPGENCEIDLTEFSTTELTSPGLISTESISIPLNTTNGIFYVTSHNFEIEPMPVFHKNTLATILWTVFGTILFLLISGGLAYWAHKKRKENIIRAMNSYTHETNVAAIDDHEILIEGADE